MKTYECTTEGCTEKGIAKQFDDVTKRAVCGPCAADMVPPKRKARK